VKVLDSLSPKSDSRKKPLAEKYLKVLDLMKSKGGKVAVNDPDLLAIVGNSRKTGESLEYRLTVYMSYIRRLAKLEVKTIRSKRKAIRYELVDVTSPMSPPGERIYQQSKYIKEEERRDPRSAVPADIYAARK